MDVPWSEIASGATALAVFLAAWQLWQSNKQAVVTFEDSLAREYRNIAYRLPTKALLGERLSDEEHVAALDEMYHYFDLCNEQAFLHKVGRVSAKTWSFWFDGMKSNFRRPAFDAAWAEVADRSSGDFAELRELIPPRKLNQARVEHHEPSVQSEDYLGDRPLG